MSAQAIISKIDPSKYIRPDDVVMGIRDLTWAANDGIREVLRFRRDERHPIRQAACQIIEQAEDENFWKTNFKYGYGRNLVGSYKKNPNGHGWIPVVYLEKLTEKGWKREKEAYFIGLTVCNNRDLTTTVNDGAINVARAWARKIMEGNFAL
jgi:hypothetical protein